MSCENTCTVQYVTANSVLTNAHISAFVFYWICNNCGIFLYILVLNHTPNRNCLYCAISSAEWNVNMRATLTGSRKNLIYASKLFYQKLINGKISIPLLRSTCFSSVGEPAIFFFYPVLMSNVNNRSYATEGYFLENKTTNELTNLVKWRHLSFFSIMSLDKFNLLS